jgi:hypothetical protein
MKVHELITLLQTMPQNDAVVTSYDNNPIPVDCRPSQAWVSIQSERGGTWMRWCKSDDAWASRVVQI